MGKYKSSFSKPIQYNYTIKYLLIPGTSILTERLFSKTRETISKTRIDLLVTGYHSLVFYSPLTKVNCRIYKIINLTFLYLLVITILCSLQCLIYYFKLFIFLNNYHEYKENSDKHCML
jgi:hypothetical protein